MSSLLHPDDAARLIASFARPPATEEVPLALAMGRVLPVAVVGAWDQPPFDKAAMDGFAHDGAGALDLPRRVRNILAAGAHDPRPLGPAEAVKIMTGAPLPPGATRVQRVEWSAVAGDHVRFTRPEGSANVIRRGENARAGATLLGPRVLTAADIAILAADGRPTVTVAVRPRVGVLSTGSELQAPGAPLRPGAIYDSNRPQVLAQLAASPAVTLDLGIVPDDAAATRAAIARALADVDILVLSGGVSMGDFDHVPRALHDCGVTVEFHGLRVKPGKPTYLGRTDRAFVFGLAGNPVSVFVHTEWLVKPLILALSGVVAAEPTVPVPLAHALTRTSADRVELVPVRIAADGVHAVDYRGSSAIQALAVADGFVRFEVGVTELAAGSVQHVRRLR